MSRTGHFAAIAALFVLSSVACGSTDSVNPETTITQLDGSTDGGDTSTPVTDAGAPDAGATDAGTTTPTDAGSLRVRVEGLKSTKGQFAYALFDEVKAGGFPDGTPYKADRIAISATSFELAFDGLPAGRYALTVYHDIDKNNKLNTGVFGQPTEPWGSTNNVTHTFSGPTFDESAVDVQSGYRTTTKIVMHD